MPESSAETFGRRNWYDPGCQADKHRSICSALIRESRKIVDREEANIEAMVRAYLLTKDEVYYKEGIKRLSEILSWKNSKYFAGDFNRSTILSMSTSAYDAWYNLLTPDEKKLLLRTIRENGKKFYHDMSIT